jgi:four helix bundle protein
MKGIDQFEAEAPILQKTTDLYKELYEHLKTFPKKDQYLLGKRCEDAVLDFLECILFAASASRDPKLQSLQKANAKFDLLKKLLRLARELKMLDNKKYLSLETRIQDIGRQLGGWIKSTSAKAS